MLFPQVFLPLLGLVSLGSCAKPADKNTKNPPTVTVTHDPNPSGHSTVTVNLQKNSTYIPPSCTKKVNGLAKTHACHTFTAYTQSRECPKQSCPLQTDKKCSDIVRATTTTVPCSTDCCPHTATTTITTKCPGCPTGCPTRTETVTVATGCPGGDITKHTKHTVMTRTVTMPKPTHSSKSSKRKSSKTSTSKAAKILHTGHSRPAPNHSHPPHESHSSQSQSSPLPSHSVPPPQL